MKLAAQRVASFLRQPDAAVRAVLLFGPDAGLVRERADQVARTVCPDLRDPFRVADLTGAAAAADPARLADEMSSLSLMGGRRVVRLREAADGALAAVENALAAPGDALLVVEAGELPKRSALRKLFDAAPYAAAIACYADTPAAIAEVVRSTLAERRVGVAPEAVEYLVEQLGNDRLVSRSELEKLALYVGEGGRATLEDAMACVGDSAALGLDDIVFAAAEGDAEALERALFRGFAEGENPVRILRAAQNHFQRLQLSAARVAGGESAAEVARSQRPPLPFPLQDRLGKQLRRWTAKRTAFALDTLLDAELAAKRTGAPQELLCRDALFALARQR
jgi:DNA polymerase-3 subunit delta